MPEKEGAAKPEKLLVRKYLFEGRALKLRVDTVVAPDGHRSTREVAERSECVAVVAVDADDSFLLVNQFRTPLWKNVLELPAGGIDRGESSETAVVREMQEETGFKPARITRLCGFYLSPGFTNEYCHLYLATDLTASRLHADDTAGIEIVRIPTPQVLEAISSGRIQDAKSIAGLLYYLAYKKAA